MIGEMLVVGGSLVGCVTCWAMVARHKLNIELQRHKITTDYEYTKPIPDPLPPPEKPSAKQQALDALKKSLDSLLERRKKLEDHITTLRNTTADGRYCDKSYAQWRADALKALEDARAEQQELVLEETDLLEMIQGAETDDKVDATEKPVRVDTGGPVARRVDDPRELRDAELHDEEAGGEDLTGISETLARSEEFSRG